MKRILILGRNSYIGKSLANWLKEFPEKYIVHSISLRNSNWKKIDFSSYDTVINLVGIAHIRDKKRNKNLYSQINRDLAFETAKKAKDEKVKHYIFLSSMSVYGIESGIIDRNSVMNPKSNYGISKLQAEEKIISLKDGLFKVAILRPPMVYGKESKGNYNKLSKFAKKTPFFPDVNNMRSMIYIDNLCQFIKLIIDDHQDGTFFPQNKEYVCTSHMVKMIANINNKSIRMTKMFNPIIKLLNHNKTINKIFGDLMYEKSLSNYENYDPIPFKETIRLTESQ